MQSPNPLEFPQQFLLYPNTITLENALITTKENLGNKRKIFAEIYVEK
jgi:hypothetical protein